MTDLLDLRQVPTAALSWRRDANQGGDEADATWHDDEPTDEQLARNEVQGGAAWLWYALSASDQQHRLRPNPADRPDRAFHAR